jgi:hypothetical protein
MLAAGRGGRGHVGTIGLGKRPFNLEKVYDYGRLRCQTRSPRGSDVDLDRHGSAI